MTQYIVIYGDRVVGPFSSESEAKAFMRTYSEAGKVMALSSPMTQVTKVPVNEISNPNLEKGVRILNVKQYIDSIAVSVAEIGQMTPVSLNKDKEVQIGGGRYLFEAIKLLGLEFAQATIDWRN